MLSTSRVWILILLCALAMSYGWGFRGDYGHEAGAMFPGCFLALSVLIASNRKDWLKRITSVALAGAIGWAFGGSMSYGKVIGYTAHSSVPDVAYGFACLFLIGALWGSIGAGCLGLSLTMKRSWLNQWAGPLFLLFCTWQLLDHTGTTEWLQEEYLKNWEVDWVAACSGSIVAVVCMVVPAWRSAAGLMFTLSVGWLLGFFILTNTLGIRMTPPRGDNWAGCLGLAIAFFIWLHVNRLRAVRYLFLVGLLSGGYGFAIGDGLNMMGRAGWGPIGELAKSLKLYAWKWMEQSFGLIMGFGIALGILQLLRKRIQPPDEDAPASSIHLIGLVFLLIIMPWLNFFKNVRRLAENNQLGQSLFGMPQEFWYFLIGGLVSLVILIAILLYRRGKLLIIPSTALGKAQWLLLFLIWISVLAAFMQAMPHMNRTGTLWVHITFWITASLVTLLTMCASIRTEETILDPGNSAMYPSWRMGTWMWLLIALVPFLIGILTYGTIAMHDAPLSGSHLRFEK